MFVALSLIPLLLLELQSPDYNSLEPLLLSSDLVNSAPYIKFYIDDIFSSKESPQEIVACIVATCKHVTLRLYINPLRELRSLIIIILLQLYPQQYHFYCNNNSNDFTILLKETSYTLLYYRITSRLISSLSCQSTFHRDYIVLNRLFIAIILS